MKLGVATCFILCLALVYTAKAASDVIVLTEANFDEKVFAPGSKDWMIDFYAPWCGHCRKLEPVWEEFAKQTKGRLNVAKVDATENEELAALYEVTGYPTIKFIRNGKVMDYMGQREKDHFVAFALVGGHEQAAAKPAPRTEDEIVVPATPKASNVVVLTQANFSQSIGTGKWLVEFYAPWCGHCKNLAPEWERLADDAKHENINVAKIDATQEGFLGMLFEVKGYPTIKYFPGNGRYYDYSGPRAKKEFLQFAKSGFQMAKSHEIAHESTAYAYYVLYKYYEKIEPYAKLAIQDYLGVTFLVLTVLALAVGFLLGRLSAPPPKVYVMSQQEYEKYKQQVQAKRDQQQNKEGSNKKKKEQKKEPKKEQKQEEKKKGNNNNNNNNNNTKKQETKNNNNNNKKGGSNNSTPTTPKKNNNKKNN